MTDIISREEAIATRILTIRNMRVMLDRDLAPLYGVTTGNLNKAIKRNIDRFPDDFMFQLNKGEIEALRFQFGSLKQGEHFKYLPYAFTEQGVSMLSAVLKSPKAVDISIRIMRAFVKLRTILATNDALRYAIEGLERRVGKNERDIQIAIKAIQSILTPPDPPKKNIRIGFCPPEKSS
jgi:phage regulator Rha-like protein